MILGGVFLLLLSIVIIFNPFSVGIPTVIILSGAGLLFFGCLLCALSFKMKRIDKEMETEYPR
jgi:uncharacterized membrane protein HdeD (DUF308 family)